METFNKHAIARRINWVRRAALCKGVADLRGVWFDGQGCIASDQRRVHVWDHECLVHAEMPRLDPPNIRVTAMPRIRAVIPPQIAHPLIIEPRRFLQTLRRLKQDTPKRIRVTHVYVQYRQYANGFFLRTAGSQREPPYTFVASQHDFVPCAEATRTETQIIPTLYDLRLFTQIFDGSERFAQWSQHEIDMQHIPLRLDYNDGRMAVLLPCIDLKKGTSNEIIHPASCE